MQALTSDHPSSAAADEAAHSILLVDDDPFVRRLLADAFADRGFAVNEASSGREAMRALLDLPAPPSLVMTDLLMPDMDGRTLLGLLSVARDGAGIPLIVVTGSDASEATRELEREGAAAVVEKRWGPETIVEVAEAVLAATPTSMRQPQ